MSDPRIGTRSAADGSLQTFPTQTLSGAPYSREAEVMRKASLPPMVFLDATRFVVLDLFPPKDFDRNAEIEKLRGDLAPKSVQASKRVTSEPEASGN